MGRHPGPADHGGVDGPGTDGLAAVGPEDAWVLQAEAAETAGCSVSAIRKWRREGMVSDRRTTTAGGLERVEVRLQDVLDRTRREPQRPVAPQAVTGPPVAGPGTVYIPLADLQALILSVGDAERRAYDAGGRVATLEARTERLSAELAQSDAELVAATSELDRHRRRIRELEDGHGRSQPDATAAENERLREQLVRLEARMAEARSEVDGQRRRIRELEARQAPPSRNAAATEAENERLREQLKKMEGRLVSARSELDGQRRRIRDLEAQPPPDASAATEAENERLYQQVLRLEASLTESATKLESQHGRIGELEARLSVPPRPDPETEAENQRLRQRLRMLEIRLKATRSELDADRRRLREWEAGSTAVDPARTDPSPRRSPTPVPVHPKTPRKARLYDDEQPDPPPMPVPPPPPPPSADGLHQAVEVPPPIDADSRSPGNRRRERVVAAPATPVPEPDRTASDLRLLYRRLHDRPRVDKPTPDEERRWIADLAAYDQALVRACTELSIPTTFVPGDRLAAEDRVALTRALRQYGLDVAGS